jgi:hypothetical protein
MWTMTSVLTTFAIFEFVAVKLLEIRTDENAIFSFLTLVVCVSFYKVKQKAHLSFITEDCAVDIQGKVSTLCPFCNMKVPARAFHCHICNICVLKRDQHCIW